MVARTPSRRRILRELHIGKIAAVDRPCQEHARMTIMKRADDEDEPAEKGHGDYPQAAFVAAINQEVQAVDFDAVLAEDEAREAARVVGDDLREKWCALQRSFDTIAADESVSAPDKIAAMQASLQQYIDSLAEQSSEIAESMTKSLTAVPAIAELLKQTGNEGDDVMTEAEKKQLDGLQKKVDDLTKQLEAATAKEPAKKAADLQADLDAAKAEVEKLSKKIGDAKELVGKAKEEYDEAVAKASMSDAEKEHMAGLSGADKMKFMQASPDDRKKMMSKAVDADPVIYKSADGTEFRKSDGDKMITLAKRNDELAKQAADEIKKREDAELTKRADDDLKHFGETVAKRDDKIEALRAIDKMEAGPKAALLKMLEVGSKAIAAAFTTIGHKNEQITKSAEDFTKRVAEVKKRDALSASEAMVKAREEYPAEFKAYQESGAEAN